MKRLDLSFENHHIFVGKSTISMAMFNSYYVTNYLRVDGSESNSLAVGGPHFVDGWTMLQADESACGGSQVDYFSIDPDSLGLHDFGSFRSLRFQFSEESFNQLFDLLFYRLLKPSAAGRLLRIPSNSTVGKWTGTDSLDRRTRTCFSGKKNSSLSSAHWSS